MAWAFPMRQRLRLVPIPSVGKPLPRQRSVALAAHDRHQLDSVLLVGSHDHRIADRAAVGGVKRHESDYPEKETEDARRSRKEQHCRCATDTKNEVEGRPLSAPLERPDGFLGAIEINAELSVLMLIFAKFREYGWRTDKEGTDEHQDTNDVDLLKGSEPGSAVERWYYWPPSESILPPPNLLLSPNLPHAEKPP